MSERVRILVVEDDRGLRESLAMVLEFQEYDVLQVGSGEDALIAALDARPHLIVLDVNLPGTDGLETCRRLRADGYRGKIVMLTARHEINDRVRGLDAGADDYLPKPFALDELLARIRALLRQGAAVPAGPRTTSLQLDDLQLDPSSRLVTRGGQPIDLTKIEFDLLELLLRNVGVVLTRNVIHEQVWGYADDLGSNSLEVFVSSLRKKLGSEDASRLIHTVRGVGYVARIGR